MILLAWLGLAGLSDAIVDRNRLARAVYKY